MVRSVLAPLPVLLLALSACGEEHVAPIDSGVISYAGALDGSDAVAAVAVAGDDVALYVCGGPSTYATRSRWYFGTRADGEAEVTSDDGGTAQVELGDGEITGTITEPGGEPFPFRLDLMPARGPGGLYFAVDSGCRTGVVVVDHGLGTDPTVQGTWCSDQDVYAQVTPISPIEDGARQIDVETVATDQVPKKKLVVSLADPRTF